MGLRNKYFFRKSNFSIYNDDYELKNGIEKYVINQNLQ